MTKMLTALFQYTFANCIVIEYGAENKGDRNKMNVISPQSRMNQDFLTIPNFDPEK